LYELSPLNFFYLLTALLFLLIMRNNKIKFVSSPAEVFPEGIEGREGHKFYLYFTALLVQLTRHILLLKIQWFNSNILILLLSNLELYQGKVNKKTDRTVFLLVGLFLTLE